MIIVFWISLLIILYTYLGYPFGMWVMRSFLFKNSRNEKICPFVSVVIAAHNEEHNISKRLQDLLQQNYPKERLEIIVSSDGSTDNTVGLANAFTHLNIIVADLVANNGKAAALNHGVSLASGEIIVFTDSRQTFQADAIQHLVNNFADPTVGCVSGELHFLEDPASQIETEMGAYWKYEKFIRKCESASGSVIGATGCIYAIRRELYRDIPVGTILDDVLTPMNVARQGKRVLFETKALAFDIVSKDVSQEWRRKVRTLAGNWQLLSLAPWILLPWKNTLWWRYVSHKLLRLLVPFAMVFLLVVCLLLSGHFYRLFLCLQLVFYGIVLVAFLLPATRSNRLVNLCYFFIVMNAAVVAGFWKWLVGGCATAWQPTYKVR